MSIAFFILFLASLVLMTMTGFITSYFFNLNSNLLELPGIGFVSFIALVEFSGWFCISQHFSVASFESIILTVIFIIFIGFIIILFNEPEKLDIILKSLIYNKEKISYLFIFFSTVVLILLTAIYYKLDADDAFYVVNSTTWSASDYLNLYESSFGNTNIATVPLYDYQIWEGLLAIISLWTSIKPVILIHSYLLPILYTIFASANLFFGRILFKDDEKKANWFYILLVLVYLYSGFSVYSQSYFLLSRFWQGKAVYLLIILPLLSAFILKNYSNLNSFSWNLTGLLSLCILAGIGLNPTSIYVLGGEMIALIGWAFIVHRKPKILLNLLIPISIILIWGMMISLQYQSTGYKLAATITEIGENFTFTTFKSFVGNNYTLVAFILLFISEAILNYRYESFEAKIYFIFVPLVIFIILIVPFSGKLIAKYITKEPTFWRLYWLLPIIPGIAYESILLLSRLKKKRIIRTITTIFIIGFIVISGSWTISANNGFSQTENLEKIPQSVVEIADKITEISEFRNIEKPMVLATYSVSTMLRQLDPNIELIYSRSHYLDDLFRNRGLEKEYQTRVQLMNFVNNETDSIDNLREMLDSYQVEYIIIDQNNYDLKNQIIACGFEEEGEYGPYILLYIQQ